MSPPMWYSLFNSCTKVLQGIWQLICCQCCPYCHHSTSNVLCNILHLFVKKRLSSGGKIQQTFIFENFTQKCATYSSERMMQEPVIIMMSYTTTWNLLLIDTVDAVVSGHLGETLCRNIKIQGLSKTGFCEGGLSRAVQSAYESVHQES